MHLIFEPIARQLAQLAYIQIKRLHDFSYMDLECLFDLTSAQKALFYPELQELCDRFVQYDIFP